MESSEDQNRGILGRRDKRKIKKETRREEKEKQDNRSEKSSKRVGNLR